MPSRDAGLAQLQRFLPKAGRHYAGERNDDHGPDQRGNVSTLSPFIRHRLITEAEVLSAVLAAHDRAAAAKFIDEVYWRGYWKGWLEHHPEVWQSYLADVEMLSKSLGRKGGFTSTYALATSGQTGLKPFDAWVQELLQTGYLHNHARMWFASIWIFTLQLPWQLGADFFLRQLLDGDPAVNTLSWRWVAGLHTKGKIYLATKENIARYTSKRFDATLDLPSLDQLVSHAAACQEQTNPTLQPVVYPPELPALQSGGENVFVITEEDLDLSIPIEPRAVFALDVIEPEGLPRAERVGTFKRGAIADALRRAERLWPLAKVHDVPLSAEELFAQIVRTEPHQVMLSYPAMGHAQPVMARLSNRLACQGVQVCVHMNAHDRAVWPYTQNGFFELRKHIPALLDAIPVMSDVRYTA